MTSGCGLLFVAAVAMHVEGSAAAYPYGTLRPADQVLAGPADGTLAAIHFNPAGLRLESGSHMMAVGGARGYFGSYRRSDGLPAGFAPDQTSPQTADPQGIGWAASDMMVAASWDLRTEAVTLGFGVYTPYNDNTTYAPRQTSDAPADTLGRLSGRYHAISDHTYSLWGTVAAGLRLRRGLFFGGGFEFAYTHSRISLMRDLGPGTYDGLPCAGGVCEQWADRQLLDIDGSGWGYGFTTGLLMALLENRLWIGGSYGSPLLTSSGTQVALEGRPTRSSWLGPSPDPSQPCGKNGTGLRLTSRDEPLRCGTARILRSFPHLIYLGARGRMDLDRPASGERGTTAVGTVASPRLQPRAIEVTSWVRLTIPTAQDLTLSLENALFPQGDLVVPLRLRTAFAVALGVRQIWSRLTLAQEVLYESPRSDPAAVSPGNLEGHKLDFSVAARLALHRRISVLLTAGVTGVLFDEDAGTGYSSTWASGCRAAGYDINADACARVQEGWALPSAAGVYQLIVPHGVAGLELNL